MSFLSNEEADFIQLWQDVGSETVSVGSDQDIPALISARAQQGILADGGFDERSGYSVTVLKSALQIKPFTGQTVIVRGEELQVNQATPRFAKYLLDCVDTNQ